MGEQGENVRRYPASQLEEFITRAFTKVGMGAGDAGKVAALMTEADLNGSDGHGIFRLPPYIRRIHEGGLNVTADIRIEKERAGMALVNGDSAQGHLVMSFCAEKAIEKARETGVAWVGSHHSNHAGPASLYAKMPLAHDMIGLYVAVGNANHLPPWGGTDMLLSTNPIAAAIPTDQEPAVVLDMATTVAAYGKVKTAAQRGEKMPEGWMVDKDGNSLTDPTRADEGFLLPIGGPKGSGLSLIFGLLAGTLNGAAFGEDVVDFNADYKTVTNTGQFIVAVDVSAFIDVLSFKRSVDAIVRRIKASPAMPGFDEVLLPGEQSHRKRQDRTENGIPLHQGLIDALNTLAAEIGIGGLA
ncbi:MAG: Ldh family oxidoreductase, partial [Rhodospirillales bacterium]|nr:Ldh family oxidoreductase [Rhodospirillales bacterium]